MSHEFTELSEMVATVLNDWSPSSRYNPGFMAEANPFVELKTEQLQTLQIRTFPASITGTLADREVENEIIGVGVMVAKHADDNAAVANLQNQTKELRDVLTSRENWNLQSETADPHLVCGRLQFPVETEAIYDINLLREKRIFYSVSVFAYLVESVKALPT